jgi:hypothetical protein
LVGAQCKLEWKHTRPYLFQTIQGQSP